MLDLPPEIASRDCSILRTCQSLRREARTFYYQANRHIFPKPTAETLLQVHRRLKMQGVQPTWIRQVTMDFDRISIQRLTESHPSPLPSMVDQLETVIDGALLLLAEVELIDVIYTAFQCFNGLQTMTLRLSMSCPCIAHHSQRQETDCTASRAQQRNHLVAGIQQYCRVVGKEASISRPALERREVVGLCAIVHITQSRARLSEARGFANLMDKTSL